jgi:hypothetical protein
MIAGGAVIGAATYGACAAATWLRFGHASPDEERADTLLDSFIPVYDVVERHEIAVRAPADVVLNAACEMALDDSPIIRAIFKARAVAMRAAAAAEPQPRGILAQTQALGWRILAESPGREVVVGAVTRPWQANPVFRPVAPHEFLAFAEPDYVKIVWTLRADPRAGGETLFRTETRALATEAAARAKFRRYWAFVAPGIWLIRWSTLHPLKREAERRASLTGRAAAAR